MQASPVPALATPARGVCCSQAPGDDTGRRIGTAAVVYVNESSSRALYNWSSAVHRQLLLQHTFWSCNTWASQRDTAGSHNISTAPSTSLEPVGAAMPPRAAQSLLLLWRDAATPQVLHPHALALPAQHARARACTSAPSVPQGVSAFGPLAGCSPPARRPIPASVRPLPPSAACAPSPVPRECGQPGRPVFPPLRGPCPPSCGLAPGPVPRECGQSGRPVSPHPCGHPPPLRGLCARPGSA